MGHALAIREKGVDNDFSIPFKYDFLQTNLFAKAIALLPARASTSSTDGGKAILSDRAPMTLPSWSLITTPRPAAPSS